MKKMALFAFEGELMCFVHVLLNGLDMQERGMEAQIILEGEAVTLVEKLEQAANPFHALWNKARKAGLVAGACRACSAKLGVLPAVETAGLPLLDGMSGHPAMAEWLEQGYEIVTF
jgi:hypothetical protein